MTWVAIAATAIGTGISAYSQYQAGQMREAQAEARAKWQRYNAKVAQREAQARREATKYEALQHQRKARQLKARQRAAMGVSGIREEGSPLLVAEDTAEQLKLENLILQQRGNRRAQKYQQKSILDVSKSRFTEKTAPYYGRAGAMKAGASLLRGAGTVAAINAEPDFEETQSNNIWTSETVAPLANAWGSELPE